MQDRDIFVQGEGRPTISLMQVKQDATIEERSVAAIMQGVDHAANGHACLASLEEANEPPAPGVLNPRDHPLYALVAHCLRYGTTRSSDKRPYVSAVVGASYEPLIDAAIIPLVEEK